MRKATEILLRTTTEVVDTHRHDRPVGEPKRGASGRVGGLPLLADDALMDGVERKLDLVSKPELLHGVGAVGLDGPAADEQPGGYVGVAMALGGESQHLPLASGERVMGIALAARASDVRFERTLG